jgi:SAM-dependent methyltransferase
MDVAINQLFEAAIGDEFVSAIISNSSDRERITKIKLRPVMLKKELFYQASEYRGQQIFHTNYRKKELLEKLPDWFEGLFRQAEIITKREKATLLVSKKGKATVIKKKVTDIITDSSEKGASSYDISLQHNKAKNYILQEGNPLPFLIDLGVMTKEGRLVKSKSDKFRQINRFLEYIEDILPYLQKDKEITILDFGCGKSYLTFALYYYLKILKGYQINVIGLDLKSEVIEHCNQLSEKYGYDKLKFLEGDIASYHGNSGVDMVVTLHACDTATDYALLKAVSWGVQVILSVPCCQHELNKQIKSDTLKPILKYGIIKERMAALITDALRAELLETKGYRVQLLEFIDMEHTPKNILIRAVKRGKADSRNKEVSRELMDCMNFLNVNPCLLRLLQDENRINAADGIMEE